MFYRLFLRCYSVVHIIRNCAFEVTMITLLAHPVVTKRHQSWLLHSYSQGQCTSFSAFSGINIKQVCVSLLMAWVCAAWTRQMLPSNPRPPTLALQLSATVFLVCWVTCDVRVSFDCMCSIKDSQAAVHHCPMLRHSRQKRGTLLHSSE